MQNELQKNSYVFFRYPPIGAEDFRYAFATAKVRALETTLLARAAFTEAANAPGLAEAMEILGSDYAFAPNADAQQIEATLLNKRTETRQLFEMLIDDEKMTELFRARTDFMNMRLAIRRVVVGKPIGTDYTDQGNVNADDFEQIFEQEDYARLPEYLQDTVELAVLGYYQDKDIRRIDYAIDRCQADFKLAHSEKLGSVFLNELFKMEIDLNNIRTMLRLKFVESDQTKVFIEGGYIEPARLTSCLDIGFEAIAANFFATPYHHTIEAGINYLIQEKSFIKLEALCDDYIAGYLQSTSQITAGSQPIAAYLLLKENEIRQVRMVLTAKRNALAKQIILDRIA